MGKIAVNKLTALKMFWNAGFDTEELLIAANAKLATIEQPTAGYYMADDVVAAIDALKVQA